MDLRGTPCPLNFIRTQLALEKLASGEQLEVLLDAGESDALVCAALQGDGASAALVQQMQRQQQSDGSVRLLIIRA